MREFMIMTSVAEPEPYYNVGDWAKFRKNSIDIFFRRKRFFSTKVFEILHTPNFVFFYAIPYRPVEL